MDEEIELKIVEQFPELCKKYRGDSMETCFHWGFECQNGWADLIQETFESLNNLRLESGKDFWVEQIKQRYGRLIIHLDGEDKEDINEAIDKAYQIVSEVSKKSELISELSGKPGKLRIFKSWLITLTDEEYEAYIQNDKKDLLDSEKTLKNAREQTELVESI